MTKINLVSFKNSIERLKEGYQRFLKDTSDEQIRDGLIQRFEFTYEISHKTLKRFMESTSSNPEHIDELSFSDLIRTANEQAILRSDWTEWKLFREMRSKTSHTYDLNIAKSVVEKIPAFIVEVEFLLLNLENRIR